MGDPLSLLASPVDILKFKFWSLYLLVSAQLLIFKIEDDVA